MAELRLEDSRVVRGAGGRVYVELVVKDDGLNAVLAQNDTLAAILEWWHAFPSSSGASGGGAKGGD